MKAYCSQDRETIKGWVDYSVRCSIEFQIETDCLSGLIALCAVVRIGVDEIAMLSLEHHLFYKPCLQG